MLDVLRQHFEKYPGTVVSDQEDLWSRVRSTVGRIQTLNLNHLELAERSAVFLDAILGADHVSADGWPVLWTMRSWGIQVARATGSEFIHQLTTRSAADGIRRIGLLGASSATGDAFDVQLRQVGRELVVRDHGRVGDWSATDMVPLINAAAPDCLVVAVTPPAGDAFAAKLTAEGLQCPVIGVGGAIDMVVGTRRRAPHLVSRLGFEWLYRLAQEPRRLATRYLVEGSTYLVRRLLPSIAASTLRRRYRA